MPPKKRKNVFDPNLYENNACSSAKKMLTEIPEWFKLSIQILLINFYPEGVAMLNNLEADYDSILKGAEKIDPTHYNFPDWESMLKSSQFKKHCLVYVDKRVLYCKGFPLPRSAGLMQMMRDEEWAWEICPKFTQRAQTPQLFKAMSYSSASSQPSLNHYNNNSTDDSNDSDEDGTVYGSKDFKRNTSFTNLEADRAASACVTTSSTPRSPSSERPISYDIIEREIPLVIPSGEQEQLITLQENNINMNENSSHKSHFAATPSADERDDDNMLIIVEDEEQENNDLVDISNDEEDELIDTTATMDKNNNNEPTDFFRRTDVPPGWTQLLEENGEEGDDSNNHDETGGNNVDEGTENVDEMTEKEDAMTDNEDEDDDDRKDSDCEEIEIVIDEGGGIALSEPNLILHDSVPPSPSPPPPRLSPQVVFEKNASERVKERRMRMQTQMRDPRKLYISNSRLKRGAFSKRKQEDTPSNSTSNSSSDDSDDSDDYYGDTRKSTSASGSSSSEGSEHNNTVICQETQYMKWHSILVDIPKLLDSEYIQTLKKAIEDGRVQNTHRDPRLISGVRSEHFSYLKQKQQNQPNQGQVGGTTTITAGESESMVVESEPDLTPDVVNLTQVRSQTTNEEEAPSIFEQNENDDDQFTTSNTALCEPINLSITIQNTSAFTNPSQYINTNDDHRIPMCVPLRNVHQLNNHLFIEEAIPREEHETDFNKKPLKCSSLWNNVIWKDRFKQDAIHPRNFFKSNILEGWKTLKRRELTMHRMDLIQEIQKYEDKLFPSRCDFYLRTALRMVELDYRTNQQFSEPTKLNGEKLVGSDEILFYVDFTGCTGGVVEFYNKTKIWNSKGFGVTYQNRRYNLNSIPELYPDFFEPFYGKLNSYSGDGNLFMKETVDTFVNRVMDATDGKGVHVVSTVGNVARVVFEDGNDESWKYQHFAQALVGLMLLREGGNMALKMYDLKQSFTVGLVYLLYRSFNSVRISKLSIFAPTSGERVIICLGRKSLNEIDGIIKFLKQCHQSFEQYWHDKNIQFHKPTKTIEELIPFSTLIKQEKFLDYIRFSNERIKRTQMDEMTTCLKNLKKTGSIFTRGMYRALVARTTELWKVPIRVTKSRLVDCRNPATAFRELRVPDNVCEAVEINLNEFNLYSIFSATEHWRFSPVGSKSKTRGFYLGVEGTPHFLNPKTKLWLARHDFRLPSRTLIYGEVVPLFNKDGNLCEEIFVIIDAFMLAGVDIKNLPYPKRIQDCEKFAMSVTKAFFPTMCKLTVLKSFDFMELSTFLEEVVPTPSQIENNGMDDVTTIRQDNKGNKQLSLPAAKIYKMRGSKKEGLWFYPSGILFFESGFKVQDFCSSLLSRVYWEWVSNMDIPLPKSTPSSQELGVDGSVVDDSFEESHRPIGSVSAKKLIDFVNRYS